MKPLFTFAALALALVLPARAAEEGNASAPGKETYASGLGEIMSLQQMRHLKLWFAGQAKNWPLADYELDELKEGFDDVIKFFRVHDDMPIGRMAESTVMPVLPDVKSAIDAHDGAKFAAAFDKLTAACNACHEDTGFGFVKIREPRLSPIETSPFSDESFTGK